MADSILERRDRFVCITRAWPLVDTRTVGNDRAFVLEDIKLINERDNPPFSYSGLAFTVDSREKGTLKKLICVKLVDRQSGMKCICDIIFLYRSKRPPQSYTLIGDINGLIMCVKEGTVPPFRAPPLPPMPESNLYPNPLTGHRPPSAVGPHSTPDYYTLNSASKKNDEREALEGIPFQINPKYLQTSQNQQGARALDGLETFRILSPFELEQYFPYDFHAERAAL